MADERITKPARDVRMEDKREYSEIEIGAARNALKAGFEWVARDAEGADAGVDKTERLYVYREKPHKVKSRGEWMAPCYSDSFTSFVPLFVESIRWEDEEPVRLRDIVPQILTDEEREWLRVVVRPFRDRLKEVEVYDGTFYGRYVMFTTTHPEKWRDAIGEDMEHMLLPVPGDWFKGIRNYNKYAPEELGL